MISNDKKEFIMDRRIASNCRWLRLKIKSYKGVSDIPIIVMESINGKVLEIIVQYMHFKNYWKFFSSIIYIV